MYSKPEIDFEELFRQRRSEGVRPPKLPGRRVWLAALFFVLLILLAQGVTFYTDWLWFGSIDQSAIMATRVAAPLALLAGVGLIGFVWLAANWLWATRRLPETFSGQPSWPAHGPRLRRWVLLGAAGLAFLIALGTAGAWPIVLLFWNQVPFGLSDPMFGRDVAFHVFTVPLLGLLQSLVMIWVAMALVGVTALYVAGGAVMVRERSVSVSPWARAHVLGLLALGALTWSAGQLLARYELLYAPVPGGLFYGPGYTAATVRAPGYLVLAAGGVALAALLLVAFRGKRWLLPVSAVVAIGILRVALLDAFPFFVQRYVVEPDEFRREEPFIADAITMTRTAYALHDIRETSYEPAAELTTQMLEANEDTLENVRLWDWQVLLAMLEQLQEIRTYYRFMDVDVDRYEIDGSQRQVMLALRELERAQLRNPTWVNDRLQFTHGFGAVVAPVDEADARGQAVLWAQDIPVRTRAPFEAEITQPRIYFGQAQDDEYVIVGTSELEFDFPMGEENARNTYDGRDGVVLSSWLRRLAFAMRFGDVEIMISDALNPDSRILLHRNITARTRLMAPFLVYDPDPYAVISPEGRLVWIYDAYTATDRYPYAQPIPGGQPELGDLPGHNYVRNSVKVAIDAYDGTPTFYIVDETDPIVRAWSAVFPTLFSQEPMSEGLVEHWRYPEALFRAQTGVLLRYHMTEPDTFYNTEDLWVVPTETRAQGQTVAVEPYYVTMRLRGEEDPEFLLMLPFSPAGKDLMIAWLAARCDPGHYGELVLYRFAKGTQIDGPQLVENRVDNDTDISAQLTLWSQSGSETIRGNLLVIPIEDALMYVEPLFLQAGAGALPELKRVIVASRDEVRMELTLQEALNALVGRADQPASPRAADVPAGAPSREADPQLENLIRSAQRYEEGAREALVDGDWAAFGREMARLREALEDLGVSTGSALPGATAAPTPTAAATPAGP